VRVSYLSWALLIGLFILSAPSAQAAPVCSTGCYPPGEGVWCPGEPQFDQAQAVCSGDQCPGAWFGTCGCIDVGNICQGGEGAIEVYDGDCSCACLAPNVVCNGGNDCGKPVGATCTSKGQCCGSSICNATGTCSYCGNAVVDSGEGCDDGNANDSDACKNDCTLNICGDGIVRTGVEQCDDGNGNSNDNCKNNCQWNVCGDGVIKTSGSAPLEQCDLGASNGACPSTCSATCTNDACGGGGVIRVGGTQGFNRGVGRALAVGGGDRGVDDDPAVVRRERVGRRERGKRRQRREPPVLE